mgnify:CR=1 FL=1
MALEKVVDDDERRNAFGPRTDALKQARNENLREGASETCEGEDQRAGQQRQPAPETGWPSFSSSPGDHGTSWKPSTSSIMAKRPDTRQ